MQAPAAAQSTIVLCTAVDAGYLPLALVVAKSIAATSTAGRPVIFYVLYDGPDGPMTDRIERWRDPIVEMKLVRHANPWADIGKIGRFPPSTLHRAAIPDVLTQHSRAIYLDVDLVVNADLSELFDADLGGHPFGAAIDLPYVDSLLRDTDGAKRTRMYLSEVLGLDTLERMSRYVQAGVALLDLEQLRRIVYSQRFDAFVRKHRHGLVYSDQCALNAILRDDIALLSPTWNVLATSLRPGILDRAPASLRGAYTEQSANPRIVHYGGLKPWSSAAIPLGNLWWRYAFQAGIWPGYVLSWIRGLGIINPAGIRRWRARMAKRGLTT